MLVEWMKMFALYLWVRTYESCILGRFKSDTLRFLAERQVKLNEVSPPDGLVETEAEADNEDADYEEYEGVDPLVVEEHFGNDPVGRHQEAGSACLEKGFS